MTRPPEAGTQHSPQGSPAARTVGSAVIRLAGDSGDGIQLVGAQLTRTSALLGNDVCVLTDFPAEIRAPAGSLAGVSGYQIHLSSTPIHTPGDRVNTLVAMNPAALRTCLPDLEAGGILIVNTDSFEPDNLLRAGYQTSPLADDSLARYRLLAVPITALTQLAVLGGGNEPPVALLSPREADRCKNFFALGLVYWLYDRPLEPTLRWIEAKFSSNPAVCQANCRTLRAGYHYGESTNLLSAPYRIPAAPIPPGRYRKVTGSEALCLGLIAAAELAQTRLLFSAAPSTPASELLHFLARKPHPHVRVFQAEDEMAAVGAALGAAFGGALGVTATSGPGLDLGAEGLGLAVMTELPLLVIDVQRAGPSTGLPTRTEQGDLLQALFGRHGSCPLVVVAPASPADGFPLVLDALRLAVTHMTPVVLLSDYYLVNGAEPWRIPDMADLPPLPVKQQQTHAPAGSRPFLPYERDARLARPWVPAGTPGLEHRIGGLEKEDGTGNVSYDPLHHEMMVRIRADKVARIADDIPALAVDGPDRGPLLVVGWGSTCGAIATAVARARGQGVPVAHAHLRYLSPLPANLGDVLRRYRRVLVPELNTGQLLLLLRARYLVDAVGLNKVQGAPFLVSQIEEEILALARPPRAGA